MLIRPLMAPLTRLRPRPCNAYISQNRTVLAVGEDGFISGETSLHGLFVYQTRLLSRYRFLINGKTPQPVALCNVQQHSWLGYYIASPPGDDSDQGKSAGEGSPSTAEHSIEFRLSRFVGDGFHEDADITNFTQQRVEFELALEIDADFLGQQETTEKRMQHGDLKREWTESEEGRWKLSFDYKAEHDYDHQGHSGTARIHRRATLHVENAGSPFIWEDGRIIFQVALEPQASWHVCLTLVPSMEGKVLAPLCRCYQFQGVHNEFDRKRQEAKARTTRFSAPGNDLLTPIVVGSLEQAFDDLIALRLHDIGEDGDAWIASAGLPVYVALFGRDILTTGWQAALATPDVMAGSLKELVHWQGREQNDWRDESPGRMIHEANTGPTAELNYNPLSRNYGSITTSAFFPVALSEFWHWTGSKKAVEPLIEPALQGLEWLDRESAKLGHGFYAYKTRSSQGVRNQAWKDSANSILDADGSQSEPPISTCEEQGFVYAAKFQLAEVLWWFGRKDEARRLWKEAEDLKRRFNEAFWMEDEEFVAVGLDANQKQIRSITSNPGHCIATGILETSRVRRVAERMLKEDLFSGWGIRTLSTKNPAYNPYSYHRGTVWPVEQGTFALAFYRYGLYDHLHSLAQAQFEAASLFDYFRLPECFSGHPRDGHHPFPAIYPKANWPQAWSASAVFCLLQALLGIYPYAPLNMLIVNPHLPDWLPEITLSDLRVGEAQVTIRFRRRENGKSDYKIIDKKGTLHVLRQPSPWSLADSSGERMVEALKSLLPGK